MRRKETKTSGIEPYVIEVMCLNLSEKDSLAYLDDRGFKISHTELYRIKNDIKSNTQQRLNLIASSEFLESHMERIDMLKTIQKEMWANYHLEKSPSKRADILMRLAELQKYLAQIYDSTRYVLQAAIQRKRKLTAYHMS
jgi:hypothetical protein